MLKNWRIVFTVLFFLGVAGWLIYIAPILISANVDAGYKHSLKTCGDSLLNTKLPSVTLQELQEKLPFNCTPAVFKELQVRFIGARTFIVAGRSPSLTGVWFAYNPFTQKYVHP